jgi:hypothetical protein
MTSAAPSGPVLDWEFLPIRAKLIEIAAALDRIDRSDESADGNPRIEQIRQALVTILGTEGDRAEQIQLIFSRLYDDQWREKLSVGRSTQY